MISLDMYSTKEQRNRSTVFALNVAQFLVMRQRHRIHLLFQMTALLSQLVTPPF